MVGGRMNPRLDEIRTRLLRMADSIHSGGEVCCHDEAHSVSECRDDCEKALREAADALATEKAAVSESQGEEPTALVELFCPTCNERLMFDTVDVERGQPIYECRTGCGLKVRIGALYWQEKAEAAALDASPELTKAEAQRVAELKGEAFALSASPLQFAALASAMRKMLPPALLAEVIAHLDPLTPFVEFLRAGSVPPAASLHPNEVLRDGSDTPASDGVATAGTDTKGSQR